MKAIAAVDLHWGIGFGGDLLVSLPEDQRGTFRAYTLGGTVVYGRKTLETFPKGKLLSGRKNIILSRSPSFTVEGATVLHEINEVLQYEKEHPDETIWVIGGADIYRQLLPFCDSAVITRIDYAFLHVDAYFPDLTEEPGWEEVSTSDVIQSEKGYSFRVSCFRNQLAQRT